ncbi:phosphatase PAP2 family protein [Qaidamihabitans albus]|uniref:phosphatase PAP2 family protein n=1 Tax=Qaidamihabitans albus TaxID=2795733 RepID=UPI0018F16237|nr:phosphatase PAP2 family protein [Qaidamihabitans albus]
MPDAPLTPRLGGFTAATTAFVALLLGLIHSGERLPGTVDRAAADAIDAAFSGREGLLRVLVLPTHPAVVLAATAAIVVTSLLRGRRRAAVLALAAPALTVPLNTWVLKPLTGRYYDDHLAYPSGHTVSLVTVLTVLALLTAAGPRTRAVVAASAVLVVLAGTGMVGLEYHYATDVAGGAAFAVAATIGLAALAGRFLPGGGGQGGGVAGERGEPADRA